MADSPVPQYFLELDRRLGGWRSHAELAREAIASGAQGLIFQERNFSQEEFIEEALKVKAVCDEALIPLLVRDNVVAAHVAGVGVVVERERIKKAREIIGPSGLLATRVNHEPEVKAAEALGVNLALWPAGQITGSGSGITGGASVFRASAFIFFQRPPA
jgi:thiamine monophosphate synthase